jgi:hypothetical protein
VEDFQQVCDKIRQEPVLAALRGRPSVRAEDRRGRIAQFENKAEELRALAEDVILPDTRTTLLTLAENYQRMAATLRAGSGPQ